MSLALAFMASALGCGKPPEPPTTIAAPDSAVASLRAFAITRLPAADSALREAGFTLRGSDTTIPIGLSQAAVFLLPPDSVDALAQLFMGEITLNTRRLTPSDAWHDAGGPVTLTFAGRGRSWLLLTEDGFLLTLGADSSRSTMHLDIQAAFRRAFPRQAESVDWLQAKRIILDSLGLKRPPTASHRPR